MLAVFATEASQLLLWRYPSLSHSAFDDVPLNPFALWASKRSQVLAPHARLNRRQPHWRTASRALRTLILCVEHMLLPMKVSAQLGALSSPASQPAAFDLKGSDAMTVIST
jgi:hypothetical protein